MVWVVWILVGLAVSTAASLTLAWAIRRRYIRFEPRQPPPTREGH